MDSIQRIILNKITFPAMFFYLFLIYVEMLIFRLFLTITLMFIHPGIRSPMVFGRSYIAVFAMNFISCCHGVLGKTNHHLSMGHLAAYNLVLSFILQPHF